MKMKNKIKSLTKKSASALQKNVVFISKRAVRSWKVSIAVVFFLGGFAALFVGTYYKIQNKSNATDQSLTLNPATAEAEVGQSVVLTGVINPGANEVSAVAFGVEYNPALLRLESV